MIYMKWCAHATATDSSSGPGERETLQWIHGAAWLLRVPGCPVSSTPLPKAKAGGKRDAAGSQQHCSMTQTRYGLKPPGQTKWELSSIHLGPGGDLAGFLSLKRYLSGDIRQRGDKWEDTMTLGKASMTSTIQCQATVLSAGCFPEELWVSVPSWMPCLRQYGLEHFTAKKRWEKQNYFLWERLAAQFGKMSLSGVLLLHSGWTCGKCVCSQ